MHILNNAAFAVKPEVVIFDIDNTLYCYDHAHKAAMKAVKSKASDVLGVTDQQFQEVYDRARHEIKQLLGDTASSHSRLLYFQRAIEGLKMKTQVAYSLDFEQVYWRNFLLASELRPGVKDFILDVRSHGITTAVVTDLTAQIQFRKLIYWGLETAFDYVVTSEEAGVDKSCHKPFEILKMKLGKAAEGCVWMIGDDKVDLNAKACLNATTLLFSSRPLENMSQVDALFTDFNVLSGYLD